VDKDQSTALQAQLAQLYRDESRRVLATLIRLLGDFDLAEEALHEAFRAAMEQWPQTGVPANPRAWLVSAGRFKAIDTQRRQRRFQPLDEQVDLADDASVDEAELLEDGQRCPGGPDSA
jgi:RNA polymerase sigma-70 factor (ECF subfamily)